MSRHLLFLIMLFVSFILTSVSTWLIIVVMQKKRIGQSILKDGPSWHIKKEGTPTMGGMAFLVATTVCYIVFLFLMFFEKKYDAINYSSILYIYAMLNGGIGIVDDLMKASKKQNKGLSAKSKFLLQAVATIIFLILLYVSGKINTSIGLPFTDIRINLGVFYYILAFFALCGFVNAVNLTDGIDGLATSIALTVGVLFAAISLFIVQSMEITFFSSTLIGLLLAFLIFNRHPAKIFMGDTGSLFLGAIIVGFSFLIDNVLLVLIYGFVFLIEAISVILQVIIFKVTGKRILKMAPIHHHFEKKGWSENKIVTIFSIVNLMACILAFILLL